MICVSVNSIVSLESVEKWKTEIQEIEPSKPIALILTKSDLLETEIENPVTKEMIMKKKCEESLQLFAVTSACEWEDFNVHKAFNRAFVAGYQFKYTMDDED